MQVQTYECEETKVEHPECTNEAIRLMEELGLEGQLSIVRKSQEPNQSVRVPYRRMTSDEEFVFRMICPHQSSLQLFASEPMPLRVLQVAAHAQSLDFFNEIIVWHKDSAVIKDPVLIGTKIKKYETHLYLLARWGDALDEMPALIKTAMGFWKEKRRESLVQISEECKSELASLDARGVSFAIANKDQPVAYHIC